MATEVIKVRLPFEVSSAAQRGAEVLRQGGLVGFATETVYGIAAVATHAGAMDRLRELKNRPARPFSVHVATPADVDRYVRPIPGTARRIIEKGWPGPVTLLLKTDGRLADAHLQRLGLHKLVCFEDTIGLRCPDEPVASAMLSAVEGPVVAPSANLAGRPAPRNAQDVLDALEGRIDLLLDSGQTRYGKDSTVVAVDSNHGPNGGWKIVREGVYDERTIRRLAQLKILFVCTGNTCRSPMAAGLARKMFADRLGASVADLKKHGVDIASAGIFASEGGRAGPEAVRAARLYGADISRHHTQPLTAELINGADLVFCMTEFHVAQVRRMAPHAGPKIRPLDPKADIADPLGGGPEMYAKIAERIERAVKSALDEGLI